MTPMARRHDDPLTESEHALLAMLVHGWPQAHQVARLTIPGFWANPAHERLHTLVREQIAEYGSSDPVVIRNDILTGDHPDDLDAYEAIRGAETHPGHIDQYIAIVVKHAKDRLAYRFVEEMRSSSAAEQGTALNGIVERCAALDALVVPRARSTPLEEAMEAVWKPRPPLIGTGILTLNAMFGGGLARDEMTVIAGMPGAGKSAVAANIALNVAMVAHVPVLYVSREMNQRAIVQRMLSARTRIPKADWERVIKKLQATGTEGLDDIDTGHFELMSTMQQCFTEVHTPLHILDSDSLPRITTEQIAEEVRARNAVHGAEPLGLVVVDYLQILDNARARGESTADTYERLAGDLKKLALSQHCHVLALSSVNRGEGNGLDRVRGSGGIGHYADNVLLLERLTLDVEGVAASNMQRERWRNLQLLRCDAEKMREGQAGQSKLLAFDGATQKVADVPPEDRDFVTAAHDQWKQRQRRANRAAA
jgi:replicative DNA helicase